ncbi:hypothetical protein AVEN_272661-1 [Araneus ventricosus]|uniref:Uncharacterized protein n=1 Tax=Araneus ventricosus TaxID=182803 RepID=A0A4Y2NNV7_ARAVE|nr:hypothetical protein AVEN_272661-1 [Araneus ventricosus]
MTTLPGHSPSPPEGILTFTEGRFSSSIAKEKKYSGPGGTAHHGANLQGGATCHGSRAFQPRTYLGALAGTLYAQSHLRDVDHPLAWPQRMTLSAIPSRLDGLGYSQITPGTNSAPPI